MAAEVQTLPAAGSGISRISTNVCDPRIYLFVATAIMLAIYINRAQTNLMRSFTMFEDKYHYMTIAATGNEADVSLIVKRIDPDNKIRFEKNVIKKRVEIKKTIEKSILESSENKPKS